jgi:hypothetical protein
VPNPLKVYRHDFNIQRALINHNLYLNINFGKIVDSINRQVIWLPQISRRSTSLVSISFPRKGFQYGILRYPDIYINGINPDVVFTFAIDGVVNTTDEFTDATSKIIRRHVRLITPSWETRGDSTATQLISVAFDAVESKDFGLSKIGNRMMTHMYEFLGCVFKNVFRYKDLLKSSNYYSSRTVGELSQDLNTNINNLVLETPIFDWPFNRHFYAMFPHAIQNSYLSHFTVYNYIKNIHPYVRNSILKNTRSFNMYNQKVLGLASGRNSMLNLLIESVLLNKQPYSIDDTAEYINTFRTSAHLLDINADSKQEARAKIINKLWG